MSNLVNEGGAGLFVAASVAHNDAITSDKDAVVAATPGLRIVGFSAKETAGVPAAATGTIKRGATAAGGFDTVYINLSAGASQTVFFGDGGIAADTGISIDWLTGQFDLAIYYKVVP